MTEVDGPDARGVYGITTAAELSGVSVPTLRLYERRGLLRPARTDGGTRRYSVDDLTLVTRIGGLVGEGINLAGVARVLALQDDNTTLTTHNEALESENDRLRESSLPPGPTSRPPRPPTVPALPGRRPRR